MPIEKQLKIQVMFKAIKVSQIDIREKDVQQFECVWYRVKQFNAHMLRFMCFVGFAWPECKTKRHFILCNIFVPWPEAGIWQKGKEDVSASQP